VASHPLKVRILSHPAHLRSLPSSFLTLFQVTAVEEATIEEATTAVVTAIVEAEDTATVADTAAAEVAVAVMAIVADTETEVAGDTITTMMVTLAVEEEVVTVAGMGVDIKLLRSLYFAGKHWKLEHTRCWFVQTSWC